MSDILNQFKTYLQAKDYEVTTYLMRAKVYLRYLDNNGISYLTITPAEYQVFIASLKQNSLSNETVNGYIKAIRQFYKFLISINKLQQGSDKPFYTIKLLKCERKIKNYFTREELDDIIEMGMDFIERVQPIKIKTVVLFFYYTGLRKSEFLNLKREDFDLKEHKAVIRVPTKNKQERTIFFPKFLSELIAIYFKSELQVLNKNAFNYSEIQILYLIEKLNEFSPNKRLTLHSLRHSFGRLLASKEIDIRVAQKLLGHKSMMTTMIYYDPDINIIRKIYQDKLGGAR